MFWGKNIKQVCIGHPILKVDMMIMLSKSKGNTKTLKKRLNALAEYWTYL